MPSLPRLWVGSGGGVGFTTYWIDGWMFFRDFMFVIWTLLSLVIECNFKVLA